MNVSMETKFIVYLCACTLMLILIIKKKKQFKDNYSDSRSQEEFFIYNSDDKISNEYSYRK